MTYGISLKTEHILHTMSQIRNMMLPANIANLSDIIDAEQVKKNTKFQIFDFFR